jgi:predicted esterase YcpF (UPF0227 family)
MLNQKPDPVGIPHDSIRQENALDVLLAIIEDAHSADPVLFGSEAAGHFAKLHEARSGLIF